MTWLTETADGVTPLDAVFGLLPAAYQRFRELYATLWDARVLDPSIVDLCRLRIASLLGCDAEQRIRHEAARSAGLTEAKISHLPSYATSPEFSALERTCIAFAEQYVLDPHGLTDDDFTELRASLTPAQIATLTIAVAVFDSLVRFRLALGIEPATVAGVPHDPGRVPASLP